MNNIGLKQRFYTFSRTVNTGAHNLFRNAWLTTAAIAIMVVTLSIVLFGSLAYKTLDDTIVDYSKNLTVAVYLKDLDESAYGELDRALTSADVVSSVTFKSKAEAQREQQDRDPESALDVSNAIETLGENPFPASFIVVLNDIDQFQQVLDIANQDKYENVVDEARFTDIKQNAFNSFISLRKFFVRASIIGGAIFGFISALIIFNTIRMAIFTRSNEIEIMKLIGATPSYIRGPFLVEAALYGVVAAILTLAIIYSAVFALEPRLQNGVEIQETMNILTDQWYLVFGGIIFIGVFIGLASSALATARYLRLKKW